MAKTVSVYFSNSDKDNKLLKDIEKEAENNRRSLSEMILVLLEKTVGFTDDKKALKVIQAYRHEEKEVLDLCRAVVNGKWNDVVKVYKKLDKSIDPESIRRPVLGYLHACLLNARDEKAHVLACKIQSLDKNTYDSGKAGLLAMLYLASTP